ncbi:MAG TPA: WYL domain-containing protein [bacterium]|nr:WYL domain-containing protein [bacterium]
MANTQRIIHIHREIRRKGYCSVREVAEDMEVSDRQVKRDIEYMRLYLKAPLIYSREKGGYYYKKPWDIFDYADEKMLLFYVFAERIAENLSLMPIVSRELLEGIEEKLLSEYQPLLGRITYELSDHERVPEELLRTVLSAMRSHTALAVTYSNAAGEYSARTIEPWHLINYSGKWYILAWCRASKEVRTFMLSRMTEVTDTGEPFKKKIDEDLLEKHLHKGYGIFKLAEATEVTIRFHGPVIPLVKNRVWHPKQKFIEKTCDGKPCVELTLPVSDFTEITYHVLGFTPHAEAVAPEEFRQYWMKRLQEGVRLLPKG